MHSVYAPCVCLFYLQQVWTLSNFVVSRITRTCEATCTATSSADLQSVTANSNTIVTCVAPPNLAPDLTGLSALQCYQCSSASTDVACKSAQNSTSSKVGGLDMATAAACTQCYVSDLWPQ